MVYESGMTVSLADSDTLMFILMIINYSHKDLYEILTNNINVDIPISSFPCTAGSMCISESFR